MFFELGFIVSFVTAGMVSFFVAIVCNKPLSILMRRIIQNDTSRMFTRYVRYLTYLVGISHGVRAHPLGFEMLAHFSEERNRDFPLLMWIQMDIMHALTAIVYMYLAFFIFGLIAYISVKAREM